MPVCRWHAGCSVPREPTQRLHSPFSARFHSANTDPRPVHAERMQQLVSLLPGWEQLAETCHHLTERHCARTHATADLRGLSRLGWTFSVERFPDVIWGYCSSSTKQLLRRELWALEEVMGVKQELFLRKWYFIITVIVTITIIITITITSPIITVSSVS